MRVTLSACLPTRLVSFSELTVKLGSSTVSPATARFDAGGVEESGVAGRRSLGRAAHEAAQEENNGKNDSITVQVHGVIGFGK
jgi:hypothetical protein